MKLTTIKKAMRTCVAALAIAATGGAWADFFWYGGSKEWNWDDSTEVWYVFNPQTEEVEVTFSDSYAASGHIVSLRNGTANAVVFKSSDGTTSKGVTANSINVGDFGDSKLIIESGAYVATTSDCNWWAWGQGRTAILEMNGGSLTYEELLETGYGDWEKDATEAVTVTVNVNKGSLAFNKGVIFGSNVGAYGKFAIDIGTTDESVKDNAILTCGSANDQTMKMCAYGRSYDDTTADITINQNGTLKLWNLVREHGTCSLIFNGGTLEALGAGTAGGLIGSGFSVQVTPNGGTIDTAGNNITIASAITGTGTLRITGGGSVTFSVAPGCPLAISETGTSVTLPAGATAPTSGLADYYVSTEDNLTYSLSKKVYTWNGTGTNWSDAGAWYYDDPDAASPATGVSAPGADDIVIIPANSTVTLTSAPGAVASITAPSTATITMGDSSYAANLTTALQNTAWQGTLQFNNDTAQNWKTTTFSLHNYGNENSVVEYTGTCKVNRFQQLENDGAYFQGTLKVTGTLTMGESGAVVADDRVRYKTRIKRLSGLGTWILGGTMNSSKHQNYKLDDISAFTGTLSITGEGIRVGLTGNNQAQQTFTMDDNAILGDGVTLSAAVLINMYAKNWLYIIYANIIRKIWLNSFIWRVSGW